MATHLVDQRGEAIIQQARVVDNDVSLAFVGLVDAENLRAHGRLHLVRHLGVDEVFHRALFPVWEQFFAVQALVVIANIEAILRAGGELI